MHFGTGPSFEFRTRIEADLYICSFPGLHLTVQIHLRSL